MCLAKVFMTLRNKEGNVSPKEGRLIGYKSFGIDLDGEVRPYQNSNNVPQIGRWRTSSHKVLNQGKSRLGLDYTSGFHIFLTEDDARNYRTYKSAVFQVEYKDIVAIGKQNSKDKGLTIIANKMRLIKRLADTDKPTL